MPYRPLKPVTVGSLGAAPGGQTAVSACPSANPVAAAFLPGVTAAAAAGQHPAAAAAGLNHAAGLVPVSQQVRDALFLPNLQYTNATAKCGGSSSPASAAAAATATIPYRPQSPHLSSSSSSSPNPPQSASPLVLLTGNGMAGPMGGLTTELAHDNSLPESPSRMSSHDSSSNVSSSWTSFNSFCPSYSLSQTAFPKKADSKSSLSQQHSYNKGQVSSGLSHPSSHMEKIQYYQTNTSNSSMYSTVQPNLSNPPPTAALPQPMLYLPTDPYIMWPIGLAASAMAPAAGQPTIPVSPPAAGSFMTPLLPDPTTQPMAKGGAVGASNSLYAAHAQSPSSGLYFPNAAAAATAPLVPQSPASAVDRLPVPAVAATATPVNALQQQPQPQPPAVFYPMPDVSGGKSSNSNQHC